MFENKKIGLGWLPDYPDFRDYTEDVPQVKEMIEKIKVPSKEAKTLKLPSSVDLRQWCSPVEDQESLGSCTAHAGVGIVEYFERRAFGKYIDASRLFLYKTTRNLLKWTGDTGAFLRTTMGALVLFGVPPEEYWPYNIADFDKEPPAFCYAFAQQYQAIRYFRHDPPGTDACTLMNRIKLFLAFGIPAMFGFTVYSSIYQANNDGLIPYPCHGERILGGHAVVAVGYDDNLEIKNKNCNEKTKGAYLIRNSWGTNWGNSGYGWLPYQYVLSGLARDWWSLIKNEWVDTGKFGL
ncbi:MAG: cysteine protease [Candidatus Schekmanbacteria bacterium]|nr:MAG: cysteine protease [Candidatus Schekmanbacteria bacterium]